MPRYRRAAAEPNWMLADIDQYLATTDPHRTDGKYVEQSKFTGPDYRQITAQEKDRFPGQITRIDLVDTAHGPAKRCWRAGWMPGDKAHAKDIAPLSEGWTVESAAAKLEADDILTDDLAGAIFQALAAVIGVDKAVEMLDLVGVPAP